MKQSCGLTKCNFVCRYARNLTMNAASFYGNAAFTKRSRNLERRLQRSNYLNQHHPPSKILFEADDECKYFASQNSALEYSDRNANKDAKKRGVFAFELDASGKRNFLVCSVEHIWMLIRSKKAKNRNFYEVIPEGKPCKLYFDIDFKITDDDDDQRGRIKRNGFEELKLFLRKVKESLTEEFGVKRFGDVIDLDSSTERKFSRHVIFDKVMHILYLFARVEKSSKRVVTRQPALQLRDY